MEKVMPLENNIGWISDASEAISEACVTTTSSSNIKSDVLNSLANWICRVVKDGSFATPEEVVALPEVAKAYLELMKL